MSRRESALGAVLLLAGMGLLLYLASRSPEPVRPNLAQVATPSPPKLEPEIPKPPAPEAAPAPQPATAPPPAPETPPAGGSCVIIGMSVRREPAGLTVSLKAGGEVKYYRTFELKEPQRIVVDIPSCRGMQSSQSVEDSVVRKVRSNQFRTEPDVFRVVVEVSSMPRYQVVPAPGGLEIQVSGGKS